MVGDRVDTAVRKLYSSGYAALDKGELQEASRLAARCLRVARPASYWYFGALGLRCWVVNYLGDDEAVERDAASLVAGDTGTDQPWFDGLAHLNLALMHERRGRQAQAAEHFALAARAYSACRLEPGQPAEWTLVYEYFAAVSRSRATGDVSALDAFLSRLAQNESEGGEVEQVSLAARLALRHARGEDVRDDALEATRAGISRALLGPVLLVGQPQGRRAL